MDVIFGVLGELEVWKDRRLVNLRGAATMNLLAALLINANLRISKTDLIRAAWGSQDVKEAQLYKRVNAVREVLAEVGRQEDLRTHARYGYELRAAEDDIDALLFQRLVRDADEAAAARHAEEEADCLRRALRLWRGPHPLANLSSEAFRHDIMALEQRYKRAAVRLFGIELVLGNHERVLDEMQLVSGFYPADRRLAEQLMTAQYRCGHPTDAAFAYERYQAALDEETGGTPDRLLRDFHFAIARGDLASIAAAEAALAARARTPARSVVLVPRQLPAAPALVGRDGQAAEVVQLLREWPRTAAPVIVISGPAGVGKTALAARAARESSDQYRDGQLYVDLRAGVGAKGGTSEILAQFLRAFGVPRIPDTRAERLAAYRTLLADRRVLVVLDDAADGTQVGDLVPASPGSAVLVTARRRLPEINGAHHVAPLRSLPPTDATALFLRVVRDGGVDMEDDPAAVDRVVELCGGLPLALRIAGSLRVHDHPRPTAELAGRLARLGPEAFAYGELSVARAIEASLERIDPEARQLFLLLGLLPVTGFGPWTAAALLGCSWSGATAVLSQLAASFVIEPVGSDLSYRFHDLTHEYARRRALAIADDAAEVAARTYQSMLTLVRRAHMGLHGGDFEVIHSDVPDWDAPAEALAEVDAAPLAWLERERTNIRAAVEHCAALGLTAVCWDLAVSSHEFYTIRGYFDDWRATHTAALAGCRAADDRRGEGIVLACLNQPALVASRRADASAALAALRRAAALLAACEDEHGRAIALRTLANALRRQGQLSEPLALFNEALAGYTGSGDIVGRWQTLRFIGQTYLDLGDHEAARRVLEVTEAIASELGDGRLLAQTRYWTGQACLAAGDPYAAQAAFDAVFDMYGDEAGVGQAYALHGKGELARRRGEYAAAGQHLTTAASLARTGADTVLEGRVWLSVAALRGAQRQPADQAAALEHATALFAECGAAYLQIRALAALADASAEPAAEKAWATIDGLYHAGDVPDKDRMHRRP
jgi:DNA-binding SARP family transcriptional activator/tetratricopeptide (TPR) repeat protein